MITASSNVRTYTMSDAGVQAILSGTHLAPNVSSVIQYAAQYQIDPNFFLAYSKWENGFMAVSLGYPQVAVDMNNPFDIICVNAPCNEGNCPGGVNLSCGDPSGNQFANGCVNPGNGWCYTAYPDLATGIEAAFWQTNVWITRDGYAPTWGSLLSVAGFGAETIPNILADANSWATQYPFVGTPPNTCGPGLVWDSLTQSCVPVETFAASVGAALAGAGLLVGSGYLLWRSLV